MLSSKRFTLQKKDYFLMVKVTEKWFACPTNSDLENTTYEEQLVQPFSTAPPRLSRPRHRPGRGEADSAPCYLAHRRGRIGMREAAVEWSHGDNFKARLKLFFGSLSNIYRFAAKSRRP